MSTVAEKKKEWYVTHRNDPNYVDCMKIARRKYYVANIERERQRCLARYYRIKHQNDPDIIILPEETPVANQYTVLPDIPALPQDTPALQ